MVLRTMGIQYKTIMKKIILLSILITILASFLASALPEGLDSTSEKLHLVAKNSNFFAPFSDYSLKFLPEGSVFTAIAGLAGLLIIFAIFFILIEIGKKLSTIITITALLTCIGSTSIYAIRPLVTDDFYVLNPGETVLEIAAQEIGYKNDDNIIFSDAYFHRGIIPNLELGIEIPYGYSYPGFGFQDILLHAKWKCSEFSNTNGITLRLDLNLANGDPNTGAGNGFTDYTLTAIYSNTIGDVLLHFNLGYYFFGLNPGDSLNNALFYSSAFEYRIPDFATKFVGEYYAWSFQTTFIGYLSLGSYTNISNNLTLDISYAVGLNIYSPNIITLGTTINF